MSELAFLIASEGHGSGGGSSTGPIILGLAAAVVAVLIYRNQMNKARSRVNVRRVPDDGRVALDRLPDSHSLAVGVRVQPDVNGIQTLLEGAR